jgi:hypothetical protein
MKLKNYLLTVAATVLFAIGAKSQGTVSMTLATPIPGTVIANGTLDFSVNFHYEGVSNLNDLLVLYYTVDGGTPLTYYPYGSTATVTWQAPVFDELNVPISIPAPAALFTPGGGHTVVIWPVIASDPSILTADSVTKADILVTGFAGIEDETTAGIQAFPNPVQDMIQLNNPAGQSIRSVAVMDLNGRELVRTTVNSTQVQVGVQELPAGMYQLRILLTNGLTLNRKILKK